jgi:4-alpha-glucanotransferase
MYIGEFVGHDVGKQMREISPTTVASLNTHDTAPFAGFWNGADIRDREQMGLLTGDEVAREQESRAQQRAALIGYLQSNGWLGEATDPAAVLKGWLGCLAASNAEFLLINLEDLWLEELPQNVPGTYEERPNWRRKEKQSLTTIRRDPAILDTLKFVDQVRRQGVKASDV